MLFENLPSELLLEIFSYCSPPDLYVSILPLSKPRLSYLILHQQYSLDLTYISYSKFLLIVNTFLPSQIVFLRLTNQYSHGLLIKEFFSSKCFHPKCFHSLRSLHLNDMIGNEIDYLPPNLQNLHIKFHKKAKHAANFYKLALQSTSVKQCYLIGGYAFDSRTCFPIGSKTIEHLHMAIKSFPNDLIVLLQNLPALTKLKTKIYAQSIASSSLSFESSLNHLNIDLHGSGIHFHALESQLLSHLPNLKTLRYHSSGKFSEDFDYLVKYSTKLLRFQFIQRGFPINHFDQKYLHFNRKLIFTVQDIHSIKTSSQTLNIHTIPYVEEYLSLPFIQWNSFPKNEIPMRDYLSNLNIYDRVKRVRFNLSTSNQISNFPICHYVNHLTLISNNNQFDCSTSSLTQQLSLFLSFSSIRHLILNTTLSSNQLNQLLSSLSLHSLDITYSQLQNSHHLSHLKILSLINETVSWKEIEHLMTNLIPNLEHLQMIVTTSQECERILDILLSLNHHNRLISIKICICQTLSDQIEEDLQPKFSSNQWISVKYQMDSWYLYIWK